MTERLLNLVAPLAHEANDMRITDTDRQRAAPSGAVSRLINRPGDVESATGTRTPGIRTSTTSYLAKYATDEERSRFMVPLYTEPNAYRLAAINAELVEALQELVRLQDLKDEANTHPHPERSPGWKEHTNLSPGAFAKARAALSRAKEQKS